MSKIVQVDLGQRKYSIHIGQNWLAAIEGLIKGFRNSKLIVVCDDNVFPLAGARLQKLLADAGFQVGMAVLPAGEEYKNLATMAHLYEQMVDYGLDRQSTLLALGGGVIGDMAGFAAATYMRGISVVQIPTTLLAQVDSSVGGKTGVNLLQGKNLVGAFHQPKLVFIDVDFIQSLPEREYLTGLAEVIKYGIIWDKEFFSFLEEYREQIKKRDSQCLMHMVYCCCSIKARIVTQDERESGLRSLLNLGHTFGHAFEALTCYKKFNHGEGVAMGMVYAARVAQSRGLISSCDLERIRALIANYGLPVSFTEAQPGEISRQMLKDKKNLGGHLHLILPLEIGKCRLFTEINIEEIEKILT